MSSGALAQSYNVGRTVSAANSPTNVYPDVTGSSNPVIGTEAYGNQGQVLAAAQPGGPGTDWIYDIAFDDDLTGWVYQGAISAVDSRAPKVTFSTGGDIISPATSTTLSWTATSGSTCASTTGYPSFSTLSNPATVSPSQGTLYGITCTLSGHSTTRYAAVNINPTPTYGSWARSLPITFNATGTTNPCASGACVGGTETRALVTTNGSLYAGLGDWFENATYAGTTPEYGAQVLRLDAPGSGGTANWYPDQNFTTLNTNSTGNVGCQNFYHRNAPCPYFQAVAALDALTFTSDYHGTRLPRAVNVMLAGFFNASIAGIEVAEKAMATTATGASGTWHLDTLLAPAPGNYAQARSFIRYQDTTLSPAVQLAFAGTDAGIYSGGWNSSLNSGTGGINWGVSGRSPEAVDTTIQGILTPGCAANCRRVMSMVECNGHLYASFYTDIAMRADGASPMWNTQYNYTRSLASSSSGWRGLTCVHPVNNTTDWELIASLEDAYETGSSGAESPDIWYFTLNKTTGAVTGEGIELHTSNFLSSQLSAIESQSVHITKGIAPYNSGGMVSNTNTGVANFRDLLIPVGVMFYSPPAGGIANFENDWPYPVMIVRHTTGTYDMQQIIHSSGGDVPVTASSARAIALTPFSGDPVGTLYSGGLDAHYFTNHNTGWLWTVSP